jgi:hypothetical protein
MVTVTTFLQRSGADGIEFSVLELSGGLEIIFSKATNKPYATVRKCTIPATFSPEVCASLVGQQIQGSIIKVPCDSYVYEIAGNIIELDYCWQYTPEENTSEVAVFGRLAKPSLLKI